MTVIEGKGSGRQEGHREVYRRVESEVQFLPNIWIAIKVHGEKHGEVLNIIQKSVQTGEIGGRRNQERLCKCLY